ncbi:hypothetical protein CF327_g912 [Tilletia walkeri]|nr:hypothetical protein CF327_g912 [Tilletia walkeri]
MSSDDRPGHLVLAIDLQLHQLSALVYDPTTSPPCSISQNHDQLQQATQPASDNGAYSRALWQKTIKFDEGFPEFQTKRGSYKPSTFDEARPRDFAMTPVGVVVRALDALLQALSQASSGRSSPDKESDSASAVTESSTTYGLMGRIGTIGVSGSVDVPILLSNTAATLLKALQPDKPLAAQLGCPSFFATPFIPNINDWTLDSEAITIQQVGEELDQNFHSRAASNASGPLVDKLEGNAVGRRRRVDPVCLRFAAALLRFRLAAETDLAASASGPGHVLGQGTNQGGCPLSSPWLRMGRVTSLAGLITTLLTGEVARWRPDEAALSMLYDCQRADWNEVLLKILEGNGAVQLATSLGSVDHSTHPEAVGLGSWLSQRYRFATGCKVVPQISSHAAAVTACLLEPGDGIIQLGTDDVLIIAVDSDCEPSQSTTLVPFSHFAQHGSRTPSYLAVAQYWDAGVARKIVRAAYCNDRWSVMDRLVNAVPVGGSIGLDNKLFTRVVSKCGIQDIRRFERGCRVTEFSDLRANARCLLEGQALSVRAGLVAIQQAANCFVSSKTLQQQHQPGPLATSNGIQKPKASRLFALGKPSGNKSIASIFSAALGSTLHIPTSYFNSNHEEDEDSDEQRRRRGRNHSESDGSSGRPSSGRGSSSTDAEHEFCPVLLGTALAALAARWRTGGLCAFEAQLHPSAMAVLEFFGCDVQGSPSLDGNSPPSVRVESAVLECKDVSCMELSNFYAALAPEHERLLGVGNFGRLQSDGIGSAYETTSHMS